MRRHLQLLRRLAFNLMLHACEATIHTLDTIQDRDKERQR